MNLFLCFARRDYFFTDKRLFKAVRDKIGQGMDEGKVGNEEVGSQSPVAYPIYHCNMRKHDTSHIGSL